MTDKLSWWGRVCGVRMCMWGGCVQFVMNFTKLKCATKLTNNQKIYNTHYCKFHVTN